MGPSTTEWSEVILVVWLEETASGVEKITLGSEGSIGSPQQKAS